MPKRVPSGERTSSVAELRAGARLQRSRKGIHVDAVLLERDGEDVGAEAPEREQRAVVGGRLDHDGVVSCDTITTVRRDAVGATIGLLFDDQEPALARAISDAFQLYLG